jgi:hypothetical protein
MLHFAMNIFIHYFKANAPITRRAFYSPVWLIGRCTPGMGVNLWGESPLYACPVAMKAYHL